MQLKSMNEAAKIIAAAVVATTKNTLTNYNKEMRQY